MDRYQYNDFRAKGGWCCEEEKTGEASFLFMAFIKTDSKSRVTMVESTALRFKDPEKGTIYPIW